MATITEIPSVMAKRPVINWDFRFHNSIRTSFEIVMARGYKERKVYLHPPAGAPPGQHPPAGAFFAVATSVLTSVIPL